MSLTSPRFIQVQKPEQWPEPLIAEIPQQPFEYDPQFSGPVKRKRCTDVYCLVIFIMFFLSWIGLGSFSFVTGHPGRLLRPVDSRGQICGEMNVRDKPFLYYFDITQCAQLASKPFQGCPTYQVCVKSCPRETFLPAIELLLGASESDLKSKLICKEDADMSKSVTDLVKNLDCAPYYLKSKILGGRCVPALEVFDIPENILKGVANFLGKNISVDDFKLARMVATKVSHATEIAMQGLQDLYTTWKHILVFAVIAMLIDMLWSHLLRWISAVMVWMSLVFGILVIFFTFIFTVVYYVHMDSEGQEKHEFHLGAIAGSYIVNKNTLLAFAVITGTLWMTAVILLIVARHRMQIAIALVEESSRALEQLLPALFFPLFIYIMIIGIFSFGVALTIYLLTNGDPIWKVANATALPPSSGYSEGSPCTPGKFISKGYPGEICVFVSYGSFPYVAIAHVFNAFAILWVSGFVLGVEEISLAFAFSLYYWTRDKTKDIPPWPVAKGVRCTLRYHLGSVALGSFILALFRHIRFLLEMIDKHLKQYKKSKAAKVMFCLCHCCLWCLEKIFLLFSKNALIMMALHGDDFCASAINASGLWLRNISRVVVIDWISTLILFITKLVVVGLVGFLAFLFFTNAVPGLEPIVPKVNYVSVPITVVLFLSYLIAASFFGVYEMAIDTVFLCFLEDCERNDGSLAKPYFMSTRLQKILRKRRMSHKGFRI